MFEVKFRDRIKKKKGDKAVMKMLQRVMDKSNGLAIVFDSHSGELMFMSKGMCLHEIDALLHNVLDNAKQQELEGLHKETKEELEILEKQNKERSSN